MTIDFLHLYCKCPHCTTLFRAAVSDIEATEGWVKCGHCRKVFDCRKNEINPADYVSVENTGDTDDKTPDTQETEEIAPDANETGTTGEDVPQISLFDDPDQMKKSAAAGLKAQPPRQPDTGAAGQQTSACVPDAAAQRVSKSVTEKTGRKPSAVPMPAAIPARGNRVRATARGITPSLHPGTGPGAGIPRAEVSSAKQRLDIAKPRASGLTSMLLAKAQTWKKRKKRSKKPGVLPFALLAVSLFALLIWQIAIVNYTKLSHYRIMSVPLMAVCSIVSCNQALAPAESGFEILHASVRRHAALPNVMSVSAKLINFSNENKAMPTLRLDLTGDDDAIIASRTVDLPDNPQFVDPALSELAPGQDAQLLFNILDPDKAAHGFRLSLVQ